MLQSQAISVKAIEQYCTFLREVIQRKTIKSFVSVVVVEERNLTGFFLFLSLSSLTWNDRKIWPWQIHVVVHFAKYNSKQLQIGQP